MSVGLSVGGYLSVSVNVSTSLSVQNIYQSLSMSIFQGLCLIAFLLVWQSLNMFACPSVSLYVTSSCNLLVSLFDCL